MSDAAEAPERGHFFACRSVEIVVGIAEEWVQGAVQFVEAGYVARILRNERAPCEELREAEPRELNLLHFGQAFGDDDNVRSTGGETVQQGARIVEGRATFDFRVVIRPIDDYGQSGDAADLFAEHSEADVAFEEGASCALGVQPSPPIGLAPIGKRLIQSRQPRKCAAISL